MQRYYLRDCVFFSEPSEYNSYAYKVMNKVAFSCFVLFYLPLVIAWHRGVSYLMVMSNDIEIVCKAQDILKVFDLTDQYILLIIFSKIPLLPLVFMLLYY